MSKEDLLNEVKEELIKRKFSELTIKNYSWFIGKFLSNQKSENTTQEDANNFLDEMSKSKSSSTLSLAASSLKFLFIDILGKPFSFKIPASKKPVETLNKEEIKKMIDSAETSKSRIIMKFIYSTGLTVSEMVNLKTSDIDFEKCRGCVIKEDGKKNNFYFSEKLNPELKELLEKHPNNQYLFSKDKPLTTRNLQKIIKQTAIKANLQKRITPHSLRFACISHSLDLGVDVRKARSAEKSEEKIPNPLDDL